MNKILPLAVFLCISKLTSAQSPYISVPDPKHPEQNFLVGTISKYILQNDSTFSWYPGSQRIYDPSIELINKMESAKDSNAFIVFGGTWCDDTQFIVPKFFKLLDKSGFPESKVSFFAVDRAKKTLGNLSGALNITNVPTIIVMRNGKEIGRVIEYGKTGKWDSELADLLK